MTCKTAEETLQAMINAKEHWRIPLMEFVDDFRREKSLRHVAEPIKDADNRLAGLLASTIEALCNELNLEAPDWVWEVPSCKEPWFVSGIENLKAIAIAESPPFFRHRKIFVLENFLSRA